jgi:hypothetical protein
MARPVSRPRIWSGAVGISDRRERRADAHFSAAGWEAGAGLEAETGAEGRIGLLRSQTRAADAAVALLVDAGLAVKTEAKAGERRCSYVHC